MSRNTRAIIDLDAIISNYQYSKVLAPDSKNIAVIKANAYGHGALKVAKTLEPLVPAFAVALFEEAVFLREHGINKPILILQGINNKAEIIYAAEYDCWLMLHQQKQLNIISKIKRTELSKLLNVWVKFDSGMHRLGFDANRVETVLLALTQINNIHSDLVLCSHFSHAGENGHKNNLKQQQLFQQIYLSSINNHHLSSLKLTRSLANSPAIVAMPDSRLEWNRPGIMLYGLSLFEAPHDSDKMLKPAMSFVSSICSLREIDVGETVGYGGQWTADKKSTIATVSVGYADGYPRQAKNGTPVFIRNQRLPLVGAVSMDMITVDVTALEVVNIGDKVELWGANIAANEVAKCANTIGYHLLTAVSDRVPREYKENENVE